MTATRSEESHVPLGWITSCFLELIFWTFAFGALFNLYLQNNKKKNDAFYL
jgi:hypothetical protein